MITVQSIKMLAGIRGLNDKDSYHLWAENEIIGSLIILTNKSTHKGLRLRMGTRYFFTVLDDS